MYKYLWIQRHCSTNDDEQCPCFRLRMIFLRTKVTVSEHPNWYFNSSWVYSLKQTNNNSQLININYIHSVVVQDFASGRVCCLNQYHYESRKRRVVMRLVHAIDKTWYTVLYHHTMYVKSLSNISIKTNFKQIARVE